MKLRITFLALSAFFSASVFGTNFQNGYTAQNAGDVSIALLHNLDKILSNADKKTVQRYEDEVRKLQKESEAATLALDEEQKKFDRASGALDIIESVAPEKVGAAQAHLKQTKAKLDENKAAAEKLGARYKEMQNVANTAVKNHERTQAARDEINSQGLRNAQMMVNLIEPAGEFLSQIKSDKARALALEALLDTVAVGQYLKQKMERFLNSDQLCQVAKACAGGGERHELNLDGQFWADPLKNDQRTTPSDWSAPGNHSEKTK